MVTRSKKSKSIKKQIGGQTAPVYDIIIIAGQSNAIGRGTRNHDPNILYDTAKYTTGRILDSSQELNDIENANIKQLNGTLSSTVTDLQISAGIEPIGGPSLNIPNPSNPLLNFELFNKPNSTIGYGLSFAKQYINDNPTSNVLLLGCGFSSGGSRLIDPGGNKPWWFYEKDNNKSLIFHIENILKKAVDTGKISSSSTIKALLWDQGETDMPDIIKDSSSAPMNKLIYETKLTEVFNAFRTQLSAILTNTNSQFPIMITGMCVGQYYFKSGSTSEIISGKTNANEFIMNTFLSYIGTRINNSIRNVYYVSTDKISSGSIILNEVLQCDAIIDSTGAYAKKADGTNIYKGNDTYHFSATSQRLLGRRHYDTYKLYFNTLPQPRPQPIPQPRPQPIPQPLPQPRPISQPQPRPAPLPLVTQQPQPRPTPIPQAQPRPAPVPLSTQQPQPRPAPIPQPQPILQPQPRPAPIPLPSQQPQPRPAPVPLPQPQPTPQPISQPQPRPAPIPQPQPTPQPISQPLPAPVPLPTQQPQPHPAPVPLPTQQPQPISQPQSIPQPLPRPAPQPLPRPASQPNPQPQPRPQPQPAPRPRPVPPPAMYHDKSAEYILPKFISGNKPFRENSGILLDDYLNKGNTNNYIDKTTYPMLKINKYSFIYPEYPFFWKSI